MLKVFLVVEDATQRDSAVRSVNWSGYNCIICGETGDKIRGLNLVRELRPDIVIADMIIPEQSGMSFLEELMPEYPELNVIALFKDSQLGFIKRGVELGVCNYVRKPIDPVELRRAVSCAVGIVSKKRKHEAELLRMRSAAETNTRNSKKRFLYLLLTGDSLPGEQPTGDVPIGDSTIGDGVLTDTVGGTDDFPDEEDAPTEQKSPKTACVVMVVKVSPRQGTAVEKADMETMAQIISSEIMGIIGDDMDWEMCVGGDGLINILLNFQADREPDEYCLRRIAQKLTITVEGRCDSAVDVGIGGICRNSAMIPFSRREALSAMTHYNVSKTIKSVLGYIGENYADPDLTNERIAKDIFLNYSYLCTQFKSEMGITLNSYIQQVRMLKAREILRSRSANVIETARTVGYVDVKYFSKCFKNEYGVTPNQFLRSLTG